MQNVLYGVDETTGMQVDLATITLQNTVVTEATDRDGNSYIGDQLMLITDRDFLYVPDLDQSLSVGDQIYLDNQTTQKWVVRKGWYRVDDNPAIYGYYLESIPAGKVRSLFLKDFNSLTFVTPKTQFTLPTILSEEDTKND